jgi:hypothetical protein
MTGRRMKHFFNPDLRVFNATAIPVDYAIVEEFKPLTKGDLDAADFDVIIARPSKWKSDIRWISASNPTTFRIFESAFERLGIGAAVAAYLDIDREPRLYFGSLVVRGQCDEAYFHADWRGVDNDAFTFLTPITDNGEDFGLLYHNYRNEIAEYRYRTGEGIVFGDHFVHSTKPGTSDEPVALLCFEFGTDRMEHWDKVYGSINAQAHLFKLPNGEFQRFDHV